MKQYKVPQDKVDALSGTNAILIPEEINGFTELSQRLNKTVNKL